MKVACRLVACKEELASRGVSSTADMKHCQNNLQIFFSCVEKTLYTFMQGFKGRRPDPDGVDCDHPGGDDDCHQAHGVT